MKFLYIILVLLIAPKECDQKKTEKESTSKTELVNTNKKATQQQDDYTIEYTAMSRGFFKEIIVTNSTVAIKNSRNEEASVQTCNREVWDEMLSKLKSIDVESLSKLEAPSQKRFYDGAAIGKLSIKYKDSTYQSSEFDHGNPPEEIKFLCDKILEISNSK